MLFGALAYVSTLWSGAAYYHLLRKHHPAAVLPAGFFVLLASAATAMRFSIWVALVETAVCALVAAPLAWMLVTPAPNPRDDGGSEAASLLNR